MNSYFISRTGKKSRFTEDSDGKLVISGLSIAFDSEVEYTTGAIVEFNDVLYKAEGTVAKGADFYTGIGSGAWKEITGVKSLGSVDSELYSIEKDLHILVLDSDNNIRKTQLKGQTVQSYDSDKVYLTGEIVDFENSLWKALKTAERHPYGDDTIDSEWVQVAGAGGGGIEPYDSDKSWKQDDLRVYGDAIYIANTGKVGNGAPFAVASSGDNTWRPVAPGGGLIPEYVESTNGNTNTLELTTSKVQVASFTAPSSGTWDIYSELLARAGVSSNTSSVEVEIRVNGTVITTPAGTSVADLYASNGIVSIPIQKTARNTELFEGDVVSLHIWEPVGGAGGLSSYYYGSVRPAVISARKVGGYIPAIGYEAQYGQYDITTTAPTSNDPSNAASVFDLTVKAGNMPLVNGNKVLLKGGVTYELSASVDVRNSHTLGTWRSELDGNIGTLGNFLSVNGIDQGSTCPAYAIYEPAVDTYVSLRVAAWSDTIDLMSDGRGEISIKAISKQLPVTTDNVKLTPWVPNVGYEKDEAVIVGSDIWLANDTIPNTASLFAVGTTGPTWRKSGQVKFWFAGITYSVGETVIYADRTYICQTNHLSDVTNSPVANSSIWFEEIDHTRYYLHARLGFAQDIGFGDFTTTIQFNELLSSKGVTLNTSNGIAFLPAGRTYELEGFVDSTGGLGNSQWHFYDFTAAALVGAPAFIDNTPGGAWRAQPVAKAVVVSGGAGHFVGIRCIYEVNNDPPPLRAFSTNLMIKQL